MHKKMMKFWGFLESDLGTGGLRLPADTDGNNKARM